MYTYEKFGTTLIPQARPSHDISSATYRQPIIKTPNGSYEPILAKPIYDDKTIAVGCAFWGATPAAAMTAYLAMRALIGTRDKLYRRRPDSTIEWVYATLASVDTTRTVENRLFVDATLNFVISEPVWHTTHHGAPWVLNDGVHYLDMGYMLDEDDTYTLDASPKTLSIPNGGALRAVPVITYACKVTNTTSITFYALGGIVDFVYTGTVVAGKSLVIDCETQSVKNDGTSDYTHFARNAGHKYDGWMYIIPGGQDVVITLTGGGTTSTVTFDYWERYV
jgi:hypothetical protein